MSKKTTTIQSLSRFVTSPNTNIGVKKTAIQSHDGSKVPSLGIDVSKLPHSERSYIAELAGVEYEKGSVNILFGQSTRDNKIRSLLEISMPPHAVFQALKSIEALNSPSLADIVKQLGEPVAALFEFKEEPPEVARIRVNVMTFAFSDSEASIECYYVSPFTVANFLKGVTTQLDVQGVVRVDTQTVLVQAIILKISELMPLMPASARHFGENKV